MRPHRIDVHHHILPPIYREVLGERIGAQGLIGPGPAWSPATSIEVMDRHGIATALTSVSAPGFWFGDVEETRTLARACNDDAAAMRHDHPGRFGILAALPLPDVDGTLREIEYAFDTLAVDGVTLLSNYDGKYLGDPLFAPVLDELNRREAVAFVHPAQPTYGQLPPEIPFPSLEFPFETTRTIVSLLYSGALSRNHGLRFIFSHAGGTLPFLVERIARLMAKPDFARNVPDGVLAEMRRLYFDLALSTNRFAFAALRQLTEPANLLFGSDFPHAGEPTLKASISGLCDVCIDTVEIEQIERGNALKLFPRLAQPL